MANRSRKVGMVKVTSCQADSLLALWILMMCSMSSWAKEPSSNSQPKKRILMIFKANLCFTFPQECIEEHLLAWIHPSLLCASLQMEKFNKQTKCQVLPLVSKISGAQWAEGRADLELESEKRYNWWKPVDCMHWIGSPVWGPGASCYVGPGPQMSLRRGLGRPPEMSTSEYIPFALETQNCFPPEWGTQTHAPSYGHPSWLSSNRLSEIFSVHFFPQPPLMLSTSSESVSSFIASCHHFIMSYRFTHRKERVSYIF